MTWKIWHWSFKFNIKKKNFNLIILKKCTEESIKKRKLAVLPFCGPEKFLIIVLYIYFFFSLEYTVISHPTILLHYIHTLTFYFSFRKKFPPKTSVRIWYNRPISPISQSPIRSPHSSYDMSTSCWLVNICQNA